jgi:hypothetical protein
MKPERRLNGDLLIHFPPFGNFAGRNSVCLWKFEVQKVKTNDFLPSP